MAELFLDSLHIVAGSERSNCVRVAKIMESELNDTQHGDFARIGRGWDGLERAVPVHTLV